MWGIIEFKGERRLVRLYHFVGPKKEVINLRIFFDYGMFIAKLRQLTEILIALIQLVLCKRATVVWHDAYFADWTRTVVRYFKFYIFHLLW
jgi:hypothetical protein